MPEIIGVEFREKADTDFFGNIQNSTEHIYEKEMMDHNKKGSVGYVVDNFAVA